MSLDLPGLHPRGLTAVAAALFLALLGAAPGHAAPHGTAGPDVANGTATAAAFTGACPTTGTVTQWYSGSHDGVDIADSLGTPIYAVGPGQVINSGPAQGYGQWIRILHPDGTVTEYGHMYQRDVSVGQQVSAGQRIALMGREGDSTGVHLHLRVRTSTSTSVRGIDPVPYLRDRGVSLPCTPDGGGGDGGTATVTAWTQARVRSCARTSCGVVSTVYANESYPADCWTTGEPVTDAGYTNDTWVRLPLRAGGAGYVSAIYLKGDETGNVSRQC